MFKFEKLKVGDRISFTRFPGDPKRAREEIAKVIEADGHSSTLYGEGRPMAEGYTVESLYREVEDGEIADVAWFIGHFKTTRRRL